MDKVRQKYIIETPSTTTTSQPATTVKIVKNIDPINQDKDHPTAHLRPLSGEGSNLPETDKSGSLGGDRSNILGVQLVTPVYGEFTPSSPDINGIRDANYPRYTFIVKYLNVLLPIYRL